MITEAFADSKRDGSILAASSPEMEALLNGSRRVYLQGPKVGHGTPIYDIAVPRLKDGTPLYAPVWTYMLTTTTPAGGGVIPPVVTPCCCIDARMKQGSYAPRNCSREVGATCKK